MVYIGSWIFPCNMSPTDVLLKKLMQGLVIWWKRFTLYIRGIEFNVPVLIQRGCVVVHLAQPNRWPALTTVLPTTGIRPAVTIILIHNTTWGYMNIELNKYSIYLRNIFTSITLQVTNKMCKRGRYFDVTIYVRTSNNLH